MLLKRFLFLTLFCFFLTHCFAQKVGLVLSGGGMRAMTHIGVIKALEEKSKSSGEDSKIARTNGGVIDMKVSKMALDSLPNSNTFLKPHCSISSLINVSLPTLIIGSCQIK